MWVRFPKVKLSDSYHLSRNYWDVTCYVAQKDVFIYGFGIWASRNDKDVAYKLKWGVEGNRSGEHIAKFDDSEKDPEKKWFTFQLIDVDEPGYKVESGQEFHVFLKAYDE